MSGPAGYDFSLNPRVRCRVAHIGREREPVLQVDDLLRTPGALVDFAATAGRFAPVYGPAGGYPGLRTDAPLDYVEAVVRTLDPVIREAFGLGSAKLGRAECSLSLVTLSAGELVPSQRVPHVDTTSPVQFAFLHYLCPRAFGGTAFYRHRSTGFEAVTPDRLDQYRAARAIEEPQEQGQEYIAGDTAHFERIAAVEAQPNRLVVYRSRLLHSGQISSSAPLSADPRRGRLTANTFLTYLPT